MRRRLLVAALTFAAAACSEQATSPLAPADGPPALAVGDREIVVTNWEDAGPGTLRAALEEANSDSTVVSIRFDSQMNVHPGAPLVYTGKQPLTIDGNLSGLWGFYGQGDIFQVHARNTITFRRIAILYGQGVGIKVVVPPDASGTIRVVMQQVTIYGNRGHGLLINDLTEFLVDEATTSTAGSPASLRVEIDGIDLMRNGVEEYSGGMAPRLPELDGARINEGGDGHLVVIINGAFAELNGDDGIQVDERGKGTLDFRLTASTVQNNGMADGADRGTGIRLTETDAGDLKSHVADVTFAGNFMQGADLREDGAGGLLPTFAGVTFVDHWMEAVRLVEDAAVGGGGDLVLQMTDATFLRNGGHPDGTDILSPALANVVAHEKGSGRASTTFTRTTIVRDLENDWWGGMYGGIYVAEESGGSLDAILTDVTIENLATFGVKLEEAGRDNLVATVNGGSISNNTVVGIQAAHALPGTASLTLNGATVQGNAGGSNDIQASAGVNVVINP